jgi:hypothetical protein
MYERHKAALWVPTDRLCWDSKLGLVTTKNTTKRSAAWFLDTAMCSVKGLMFLPFVLPMTANIKIKWVCCVCRMINGNENGSPQIKVCPSVTVRPQISHVQLATDSTAVWTVTLCCISQVYYPEFSIHSPTYTPIHPPPHASTQSYKYKPHHTKHLRSVTNTHTHTHNKCDCVWKIRVGECCINKYPPFIAGVKGNIVQYS